MLVFTTAMKQETDTVRRCLNNVRDVAATGYRAWTGTRNGSEFLAVQTGIGKDRARGAIGTVLETYPVEGLISVGFGGALTTDLRPGHVILCSTTLYCEDGLRSTQTRYKADEALIETAVRALKSSRLTWNTSTGVTVPVVADRYIKEQLKIQFGAAVCEMEDSWLAQQAAERSIPFLAVRIIMDTLEDNVERYLSLGSMLDGDGRLKMKSIISGFLVHPVKFSSLASTYRAYRKAKASLTQFTCRFLDSLE